jgi:hypothetical protein
MRKAAATRGHPPVAGRPDLRVTIASAVVAYVLLVLTCGLAVERLVAATPPDIVMGITQAAAAGWLAP